MMVLGLMSGTSADGVDVAITDIRRKGEQIHVKLVAFHPTAYPPGLRDRILAVSRKGTVSEICHLNAVMGEVFAKAALASIKRSGLSPRRIHLIGSHGQTIQHRPRPHREPGIGWVRSTLQIGDPAIIFERTGIPTVAHFREGDLAAGGEGAPLTPYVHHLIFGHPIRSRAVINLGGIANLTVLPAGRDVLGIQAFDTGPCNMVLDGIIRRRSHGKHLIDRHGTLAKRGRIEPGLLKKFLAHPFFRKRPPKSTGREEFGEGFVSQILNSARLDGLTTADILATCCRFIADSIQESQRWVTGPVHEVIVGGGGVYNARLMSELRRAFEPIPVVPMEQYGAHSKAFEAMAFAVLAYQAHHGHPANLPAVTGARRRVILGSLVPAGHPNGRRP